MIRIQKTIDNLHIELGTGSNPNPGKGNFFLSLFGLCYVEIGLRVNKTNHLNKTLIEAPDGSIQEVDFLINECPFFQVKSGDKIVTDDEITGTVIGTTEAEEKRRKPLILWCIMENANNVLWTLPQAHCHTIKGFTSRDEIRKVED